MIPIGSIASVLAILVSIVAIFGFILSRRQAAIEEGKHLENIQQLLREHDQLNAKIYDLESRGHVRDVDVGEIKTNIEHLLEAVRRIELKLDEHIVKASG